MSGWLIVFLGVIGAIAFLLLGIGLSYFEMRSWHSKGRRAHPSALSYFLLPKEWK